MRILFIHQNLPAQFTHPIRALCASGEHEVYGIAAEHAMARCAQIHPGLKLLGYKPPGPATGAAPATPGEAPPASAAPRLHPYLTDADNQVRRGQAVARALLALKNKGITPDVALAHPGWGESLFFKDIFPDVPLIGYFEYFFTACGGDVGFDPEFPDSIDNQCRLRVRNALYLSALESADVGLTPTHWQQSRFPAALRSKIEVIHEGVDTEANQPDPQARFEWQGQTFEAGQPIITYVARGLEPYRGFHGFMRALPELLRRNPQARVLIVGGDAVSYGRSHPSKRSWREVLLDEVGPELDASRVFFTGKLPRDAYLKVLQVSAAHVYLTYPFVLSWSMLEAMACGALIIGSRTAPVEEVIRHGENGLLVDFFDREALLSTVTNALNQAAALQPLRAAARATVVAHYDLRSRALPATLALIERLARPPQA